MSVENNVKKLSPGSAARRERIISAALELIRTQTGAGFQVREVAERAEVALGTLYRYFPSRLELLAVAYERWRDECLEILSSPDQFQGKTNAERVGNVTKRDFRFLELEPCFCEISMELSRSSDAAVISCLHRIRHKSYHVYRRCFVNISNDDANAVIDILATVIESQANLFGNRRVTSEEAYSAIDKCVYMLLVRNLE